MGVGVSLGPDRPLTVQAQPLPSLGLLKGQINTKRKKGIDLADEQIKRGLVTPASSSLPPKSIFWVLT